MLNQGMLTENTHYSAVPASDNLNELGSDTTPEAESFTVYVRVRPLHPRELNKKHPKKPHNVISVQDNMVVVLDPDGNTDPNTKRDKMYLFDGVFSEEFDTKSVCHQTIIPLLGNVLNGYNATLFAYGMTGAGKTHTLFGELDPESLRVRRPGLIFLTLQELFRKIQSKSYDDYEFSVRISYLEIYNEQVRDLLRGDDQNLMILEDPNRGVFVSDLTETPVTTEGEIMQLIMSGNSRRIMASTSANTFSSRSHAIVQVLVERKEKASGIKGTILQSKLSLIDLAGSERAAATENRGLRMLEGANINRSLLALGNCINVLSDSTKKGAFVPYRDSKLTRLLKDSLGGNTKTIMIACVSPSQLCYEETINTLKYASRAKNIKRKLHQNVKEVELHVSQYKEIIENLKSEVESLKKQLKLRVYDNNKTTSPDGKEQRNNNDKTAQELDEKKIEDAGHKILDNLEQNWEIAQTLRELKELEAQNREALDGLYKNLENTDREEKEQILKQIETLKMTMENNERTKNEVMGTLQGNIVENTGLAKSVDTLEDIELAKKLLNIDKLNLVSQNVEIKKEALNLAKTKIQQDKQISQMGEEMRRMKALLQEKDRMLASNNELIQDLRNRIPGQPTPNQFGDSLQSLPKDDQIEQKGQALQNILVNLEKKLANSINELDNNNKYSPQSVYEKEEIPPTSVKGYEGKGATKNRTFEEYMRELRQRSSIADQVIMEGNTQGLETKRLLGEIPTNRTYINETLPAKDRLQLERRLMDDDVLLESFNSLQQQIMAPTPSDILQRVNKYERFEKPMYGGRSKIVANHNNILLNSSTLRDSNMKLVMKGFNSGAYDTPQNLMNMSDLEHLDAHHGSLDYKENILSSAQHTERSHSQNMANNASRNKPFYYPLVNQRDKGKNLEINTSSTSNDNKGLHLSRTKSDIEGSGKVGYSQIHNNKHERVDQSDWQLRRQSFQQMFKENNLREHSLGHVRGSVRSTRDQSREANKNSNSIVVAPRERLFESVLEGENRLHNESVNVDKSTGGLEIRSLGQEREMLKMFRSKLNNLAGMNVTKLNKDLLGQISEVIEEYNQKKYILPVKDQEILGMLGETIIKYGAKALEEKVTKPKQNNSLGQEEKKARSASVRRSNDLMSSKENKEHSSYYQQSREKRERKISVNSKARENGDNNKTVVRRSSVGRSLNGPGVLSNINTNQVPVVQKVSTPGYKAKAENLLKMKTNQTSNPPVVKKVLKERQSNTLEPKKYASSFIEMVDNQ